MNFVQNKNLDIKRIQEAIVLFAVACITISYFGGYYLIITTIGHHSRMLRQITVALLFFKVATTRYTKKEFLWVMILSGLAMINYHYSGSTRAIYNALMLCALKDVDLKKVFKVSLVSLTLIVSLLAILSLAGVTGTVSVTQNFGRGGIHSNFSEDETRFYMGYIHPNTWAHAVFMGFLLVVAAFYEKIDWKGITLLALANYALYRLAVSRTCFLCGIVLVILLLWAKYAQVVFDFILIRIGVLLGVSSLWCIIFTVNADLKNSWEWEVIDWKVFTGRISQAQLYFQEFGLSLFGRRIPDQLESGHVLDMGYMRMLLENGVIIFGIMFLGTMALLVYAFIKKRNDIVIATICICMYGIYENQAIAQIPANLIIYYCSYLLYEKGATNRCQRKE